LHDELNSFPEPAMTTPQRQVADLVFELRFDSLVAAHRSLAFPCDARGQVDLDELCDRSRSDYLFAHTLIGRDFTMPVIRACAG
jgi:hypothetical protein